MENPSYKVYCLCYNNPIREQEIKEQFKQVGLLSTQYVIFPGVGPTDSRLCDYDCSFIQMTPQLSRVWSITYGHLDMIQMFLQSNDEYGIMCEDDLVIHREFSTKIPGVAEFMKTSETNLVMLSYLMACPTVSGIPDYHEIQPHYFTYPDDLWGTQMYMVSRFGAKQILDKYASNPMYPIDTYDTYPFGADWTITKCPFLERALISPMLAIEDGKRSYEHYGHPGQYSFHNKTFHENYIENEFI